MQVDRAVGSHCSDWLNLGMTVISAKKKGKKEKGGSAFVRLRQK